MSSDLCLPDTSAILAMMDDEDGAAAMATILRTKRLILPSIVLLEVYYKKASKPGVSKSPKPATRP